MSFLSKIAIFHPNSSGVFILYICGTYLIYVSNKIILRLNIGCIEFNRCRKLLITDAIEKWINRVTGIMPYIHKHTHIHTYYIDYILY